MIQIFIGIFLILGLPAIVLFWTALAISNAKTAQGESDLLEDQIAFGD